MTPLNNTPQSAPWLKRITRLEGVGEKLAERIAPLIGGQLYSDLIFHKPTRWVNRSPVTNIAALQPDEIQTVKAKVQQFNRAPRGSKLQKIRLADDTGFLTLVFFNGQSSYLQKQFPVGRDIAVSGLVEDFHGQRQITHPDYVVSMADIGSIPRIEPVYPLTAGITNKRLHGLILQALGEMPEYEDWLDETLRGERDWPSFSEALDIIHRPEKLSEAQIEHAVERLAYDEALARALTFRTQRVRMSSDETHPLIPKQGFIERFKAALPYAPTGAQARVMEELRKDLAHDKPMQRMLQGDVGSGKTTIAAFATALADEAGAQIAVMAPTEVLARQLFTAISAILQPLGIRSACLTGGTKKAERNTLLPQIENGEISLVCGTHALFQEGVEFHKLSLVIIDEQHRFGVNDRAKLAEKGHTPHLMIMSATPIPRSLAMTVHGDLDLSILDEKPAGRQPVETRTLPDTRLDEVMTAVGRAIAKGEQAFWVCPRVEEDEDGRSAEERFAMLDAFYEKPVGLVHGRMSSQAKDQALTDFRDGKSSVLVATTVIEVGVDVPGATIMVIEGAERFGLAQLHQLRGRVGRGSQKSYCLLLYKPPLGVTAKRRLETLRDSEDGFYIAEMDFKLRGPGDILGLQQSGLPDFKFIDLSRHQDLLAMSQKDAALRLPDEDGLSPEEQMLVSILGPRFTKAPKV